MNDTPELKYFSTFYMGGKPRGFYEIKEKSDISPLLNLFELGSIWVLGSGSNTIFTDSYIDKVIVKMSLYGIEVVFESDKFLAVKVAAGEIWDDFVAYACDRGYGGVELLSGIPGTVGAAPVQNIGAYGKEVGEVIDSVECFDLLARKLCVLTNAQCKFRYRDSIFKSEARNRYIITSVQFKLVRDVRVSVHHPDIVAELSSMPYTAMEVRRAVLAVRERKLPNVALFPNVGSFFKNPIVSKEQVSTLRREFPTIPIYLHCATMYKVSAGWLIESVGYKGFRCGDFQFSSQHALVLVHLGGGTMKELLSFVEEVRSHVLKKFGIELSVEPNLVT